LTEDIKYKVLFPRVLRKTFGFKRDGVWAGHVARMGKMRNSYTILIGKPERKRPLRIPKSRWGDNISIDLREMEAVIAQSV
jgi:hypothetical protein